MIYNISKSLMVIVESILILKNDYSFKLYYNFELLAVSRNFEEEYYLNQTLLIEYCIRIMDIIKTKPEKFLFLLIFTIIF